MSQYDVDVLVCPKCGFEQPETPDCASCGIIFEKWQAQKEPAAAPVVGGWGGDSGWSGASKPARGSMEVGGVSAPPSRGHEQVDARAAKAAAHLQVAGASWGQGAGTTLLPPPDRGESQDTGDMLSGVGLGSFRVALGLAAAGLAGWLAVVVNPLDNITVMGLVAVSGGLFVWTALSFKVSVTRRQLVFESILALVVIAGVAVTMPGLLGEAPPLTVSLPEPAATTTKTPVATGIPKTPLGNYARAAQGYLEAVESVLGIEGSASHAEWDALTPRLEFELVVAKHQALSERDRGEALQSWKAVKVAGELMTGLLQHRRQTDDGSGFEWLATRTDRARASRTHAAAVKAVSVLVRGL